VEGLFWLASQCLGKGRTDQLEPKLGRALGQLRHLYRIETVKGMSERQSKVSSSPERFKSAGAGQELCLQSLKELPAATTAILQFARLRLDDVRSKPSIQHNQSSGPTLAVFPSNLGLKRPEIEQQHLAIGADIHHEHSDLSSQIIRRYTVS
jgi:hypothetical protein